MSSPIVHPQVDVVVLGLGQCGGPVAAELSVAGHKVVGLERGPFWDYAVDWAMGNKYDEYGIMVNRKFDFPCSKATFTMRNNSNQFALPVRRYTKDVQVISMGYGVGGMGVHYAGAMGRIGPWAFQAYSSTANKYGTSMLPSDHDLEDWPITYDDAAPYYTAWEKAMGISGTNQDPFEPGVSYFTSPHPDTPVGTLFRDTAKSLGYHPFPSPSALISSTYTNQYGISRNACLYCGWCAGACNFPCEVGAKSSSHVTTVPAAVNSGNFDMRLFSTVFRIDKDSTGKIATGVRYYDASGNIHVQPAKVVYNALWGFNLIRMMMTSGIGTNYNPVTQTGSLGRAPTELGDANLGLTLGTINIGANAYCTGNGWGGGYQINDFADDNFDHTGLDFIGGGPISVGNYVGSGPNNFTFLSPSPDNMGSTWKATQKDSKLLTKQTLISTIFGGPQIPEKSMYIDLDPHYSDVYGDPLPRVTMDYGTNELNSAKFLLKKYADIFTKMGCTNVTTIPGNGTADYHMDDYQAHTRGGAKMGSNPSTSVFNKWCQCWDMQNLFAAGEILETFGDNTTAGTHVAGMMAYLAADGIKKYLATSGSLV